VLSGTTYDYTMVGTNPAAGSATTTVPVELIPISFSFAGGGTIDATSLTSDVTASPIFANAKFRSGSTQLVDAMRRAEFWSTVSGSAPKYHLLLASPVIEPTLNISVPAGDGSYVGSKGKGNGKGGNGGGNGKSKTPYGYVSYEWFVPELESVLAADNFSVGTLPIAFSGDIFLYQNGNEGDCCIYGFHGATSTSGGELTFAYGNYLSNGLVGRGKSALEDIYSLSHETIEWSDDPYVDNVVPMWDQPGSGTCFSDLLEGADAVEALSDPSYKIKTKKPTQTWHPSDVAGISWFAHSSPSQEINGLYSYDGLLTTPSTVC